MFGGDGEVEFTDAVDPGKADDATALDHGEAKPAPLRHGERQGGSLQEELFEEGFNIAIERRVIGSDNVERYGVARHQRVSRRRAGDELDGGRLHVTIMTIRSDAEANST